MYCLANICYVCLEKKSNLIRNINNSSVNEDIIHIIGYLPFNLGWLKTKRTILICEECCLHLRESYQFMKKCLKNSAVLQAYIDDLNATPMTNIKNEAELLVKLNIAHKSMDEVKCEIQSEDEEIYKFQWQPNIGEIEDVFVDFEDSLIKEGIICKKDVDDKQEYPTDNTTTEIIEKTEDVFVDFEDSLIKKGIICKKKLDDKQDNNSIEIIKETEDVFMNLEDYFVKEENTVKRDEYLTDNNYTNNIDNESNLEISLTDNANITNTDCVSSEFTYTQAHATNKNDLNIATKKLHKCSSCSKSFITKSELNVHTKIHTDKKSYECAICKKRFCRKANLIIHIRIHTEDKPYNCKRCKKCFTKRSQLVSHMRVHTGEKPYNCTRCKKCFSARMSLVRHMRIHTGEKPYECNRCKKRFTNSSHLVCHMRLHTSEKSYECAKCKICFAHHLHLVRHMREHTGEKPYQCSKCKRYFSVNSRLVHHMRIHAGEKPYSCSRCKKCFNVKSNLMRHIRIHTGQKP